VVSCADNYNIVDFLRERRKRSLQTKRYDRNNLDFHLHPSIEKRKYPQQVTIHLSSP